MKTRGQAVLEKHLSRFLGRPRRVTTMTKNAASASKIRDLEIAQFAPGGPRKPVVYATVGAYRNRMPDGRRIEALMTFASEPGPKSAAAIRRLLSALVLTPEAYGRALAYGTVVEATEQLAQLGSKMTSIVVMPPMPFAAPFHKTPLGKEKVDWLWAVPVYDEEAAYAREHGADALFVLFAAQMVALTNPRRKPADTKVAPEAAKQTAFAATVAKLSTVTSG